MRERDHPHPVVEREERSIGTCAAKKEWDRIGADRHMVMRGILQYVPVNLRCSKNIPCIKSRVRHWYDRNSVKFYNEHNVLRFEMTMNDPTRFMIYRYAQNQSKSGAKKLRPMRKGIADTAARTTVC